MGPRPADFDERVVKMSPTYKKWCLLKDGEKLRYACREFIKGNGNDEERLLRRVMIARRNNIRDHELLKKARLRAKTEGLHQQLAGVPAGVVSTPQQQQQLPPLSSPPPLPADPTQQAGVGVAEAQDGSLKRKEPDQETPTTDSTTLLTTVAADGSTVTVPQQNPTATTLMADGSTKKDVPITQTPTPVTGSLVRKRAKSSSMSDLEVKLDMDEPAVEATRSYKTWLALPDGAEFTYNQSYTKGKQGHDWLLKKNIWRRMRYRRENKKMVERMKKDQSSMPLLNQDASTASAAAAAAAATAHLATAPPVADVGHHHTNGMGVLEVENGGDNPDATAAAVAAASSGCSAGEDLVNTAIVEAAVAAAASYVKNIPQAAPMKLDHQEADVVVDPTQAQAEQQQETVTNYTMGEEAKDPTTTVAGEVVVVEEKNEHDPIVVIANIADPTTATTTQDPLIQEIAPEQAQEQMQMQEQIQEIPQEGQLQEQQQEMQQMIVEHVQDQEQEQIPQEHAGQEAKEAQPEESNNNNNIVDTDAVVTTTEGQQADEENTTSYTVAI